MKRPRKVGPTVGPSFEVGMEGLNLMRSLLPSNWLLREQTPDFFVDFMIETVAGGEVTGSQFGVQIKGTRSKKKAAAEGYGFTVKHLRYYLRCPHPIFLFLAHIPTKSIRWVFAQEYILKCIGNDLLDKSKVSTKIKVKFKTTASLVDLESFKEKLDYAHQFVRDLKPGSIKSAIEWRKKELELKDPRLAVGIDVINGVEYINITPKENISFGISVLDPDDLLSQDLMRCIESGDKIYIPSQNLRISGLPMFGDLTDQISGITLGPSVPRDLDLDVSTSSGQVIKIPAKGWVGSKYMTFEGVIPDAPVSIKIVLPKNFDDRKALSKTINFSFSIEPWEGNLILYLPYFEDVFAVTSSISDESGLKVSMKWKGNLLCQGILKVDKKDQAEKCQCIMNWLVAARVIAGKFGINPILPRLEDISKNQWNTVYYVYDLLLHGKATRSVANAEVSSILDDVDPTFSIERKKSSLSFVADFASFDFFGTNIFIGPINRELTNMEIKVWEKVEGEKIKAVFKGDVNSELTESLIHGEATVYSNSWD